MIPKLKIAIVARGLSGPHTGPKSYIQGFTEEFLRQAAMHEIHIYYNNPDLIGCYPQAVEHYLPATNPLVWDHILLPYKLLRECIDLAIFPKGTISLWRPCQAVTIMLDLGYFHTDLNAYKKLDTLYMRLAMKYASLHSEVIFTISENTRQDVIYFLGAPPEKVINILGAANRYAPVTDPQKLDRVRNKYNLIEPFIFYPTNVSPRKNFQRLLDAFEMIQDRIPHHLYFTGGLSWNAKDVFRRLQGTSPSRIHQLGEVAEEDMAAIYSLAQFSIYPSLFEGFGLPILEAFQCGSPMLVSNQASLPEVAGNAALIIDGYSVDSIAEGLLRMATDPVLRAELRIKGFTRAKEFTWEKTVSIVTDWINGHFFS